MKLLQCDLCSTYIEGETFEEWLHALRHHYNEAHLNVMEDTSRTKEEMEQWMVDNHSRFTKA